MNTTGILCFSTSNYDSMVKFFRDFGFRVTEDPRDQLVPLFNQGRGAHIERGGLLFNLEESSSGGESASFNLCLTDYSGAEVERIKALGYVCDTQQGLYGECHTFRTPDGGRVIL